MTRPAEELRARLARLDAEAAEVRAALVREGFTEEASARFLSVRAGEAAALVPAAAVREIVRLIAFTPLPDSPDHVLGSFLYRGQPLAAVSLPRLLGARAEPSLDAHLIIFEASHPFALVVDLVEGLLEASPLLSAERLPPELEKLWRNSNLTRGIASAGGSLRPILNLDALAAGGPP